MSLTKGVLISLSLLCFESATSGKLPSKWKVCKQPDMEKRDECLKEALPPIIKHLTQGEPSLGVLPIDPLHINSLAIHGTGPVSINLTFIDFDLIGIGSIQFKKFHADWKRNLTLVGFLTEPLRLVGDYDITGKVLILPIVGKGKVNLTFSDFGVVLSFLGNDNMVKNGKKHYTVEKCKLDLITSKLHFHFENLFNGDKALGDNMLKFLNENWKEILQELRTPIEKAFGEAFRSIANRLFHKVPLDEIAPS